MSLTAFRMWLRALLQRGRVESEMEKEMRLHLELETEANIRAGMSPADARRSAVIAFGGVDRAKEDTRDARLTRWLEHIGQDVRFAMRGYRKSPGFALSVTTLLALGIGANAALLTVMYQLLIAPLPYPDGHRMTRVLATANGGAFLWTLPRLVIDEWAATSRATTGVVPLSLRRYVVGDTTRGDAERLDGTEIPPGALSFVGAVPLRGRDILASDTAAGAEPVVLLSHGVWQRRFGGADRAVGRSLTLDGRDYRIIGVAPPGFAIPFFEDNNDDVFPALRSGNNFELEAVAKLHPQATTDQANRELAAIFRRHELHAPVGSGPQPDVPIVVRPADMVRPVVRNMVVVLVAGTALVLLIASANVANLLMARAWSRQRETGLRAALGAGKGRLFQQVFIENALLAAFGGALGVVFGRASLRAMAVLKPEGVDLALDHEGTAQVMLAATVIIAALSVLVFGLGPAIAASGVRMLDALKSGARTITGTSLGRRLRAALVVGEVALSVVLLAGAGLLVRSLVAMQRADIGMEPRGLHGVFVQFPASKFPNAEDRRDALSNIMMAVRGVAGVSHVTTALTMPPDFASALSGFALEGRELNLPDSMRTLAFNSVTPDFFDLSRMRIVRGRRFAKNEESTNLIASNELMVNEAFVRRFFPDGDALGKGVKLGQTPWAKIVGVVADVHTPGPSSAWEAFQVYRSMPAAPTRTHVIVRSALPRDDVIATLTKAIRTASPLATVGRATSSEEHLVAERRAQRFMLRLVGIFAGLALLLASVGLHAVIAYAVNQRQREFGVRIALGAQPSNVLGVVHRQGLALVFAGIVTGTVAAVGATRLMRSLLYGVEPGDPLTLLGVTVVMVATAVVATHWPARRATRVNPIEVLRVD